MSILNKFLMQTTIITSLVAVSLIAIPVTEARADRGEARYSNNHNGNRIASASRYNRRSIMNNRQHYKAPSHSSININYNSYNSHNRYNRYNSHYNNNYNRRYRYNNNYGHNNRSFITGLVGGAVLFSALNNNYNYGYSYSNYGYANSGYSNYAYAGYGYPGPSYPNYNYYNRPRTKVVYVDRPVVPVQAPTYTQQAQQQAVDTSCLQTREYTTDINIGGQTVPAYGQACLQPDGSWKFGEATPVPNF